MKTKIKTLLGAVLSLLVTFGLTHSAAAQTTARIAFQERVTVKTPKPVTVSQIFSMNPDGSGVAQLTSASASAFNPSWSPGQQYIAFARSNLVWVMDAQGEANGGRSFPVAATSSIGFGLDWSPDGTMICYKGPSSDGFHGGLYLVSINPATGEVGAPVLVRGSEIFWPAWSPDGTRIAFCDSGDDPVTQTIKIIETTTFTEIASFDGFDFGGTPTNSRLLFRPKWNPNATQIAFEGPVTTISTSRSGKQTSTTRRQIFIANADGTGITQVTNSDGSGISGSSPAWSPDGSAIAFSASGIYKIALGTGITTLLRTSGNALDWNP